VTLVPVMGMRNRPIFVFVLATALALTACSASGSPSAAVPSTAAPTTSPTSAEAECPYPDGAMCRGPLAAGGPYKTRLFVPVFSHQAGEGWDNTVDSPNEYVVLRTGPDGQPLDMGIYIFRDVAIQAASCKDEPEPGVGRTPADMASYMRDHAGLITTRPEDVNVGGLDGVMIEVALDPTWTKPCHYSEGEPNVPLFWGTDADSGLEWSTGPGVDARFYILDMPGGGNVLIAVEAFGERADFQSLREAAIPLVESITFDPNYY
jgi:hypothetical protein